MSPKKLVFHNTRNYGPSGLRCSLRLRGDIQDIMYRSSSQNLFKGDLKEEKAKSIKKYTFRNSEGTLKILCIDPVPRIC